MNTVVADHGKPGKMRVIERRAHEVIFSRLAMLDVSTGQEDDIHACCKLPFELMGDTFQTSVVLFVVCRQMQIAWIRASGDRRLGRIGVEVTG